MSGVEVGMRLVDLFWLFTTVAALLYGGWACHSLGPGLAGVLFRSQRARVLALASLLSAAAAVLGTVVYPVEPTAYYLERALVLRPAPIAVAWLIVWLVVDEVAEVHNRPRGPR